MSKARGGAGRTGRGRAVKSAKRRTGGVPAASDQVGGSGQAIQAFIDLLKQHNLAELEFEREGFRIRLKRELGPSSAPLVRPEPASQSAQAQPESQAFAAPEHAAGLVTITSPIVGTFYRSPSPDADPYVEEGDVVKKGQVLCIVEAMKLMNEIESEVDGRVVKVLAESTKPVEYGQPLFLIDPSQTA
ncbi:acetyl-CoA carboxylase biotin carboxyl carrier protein [Candidatus Nitrospira bockiana]